jgi:hypothetical protein
MCQFSLWWCLKKVFTLRRNEPQRIQDTFAAWQTWRLCVKWKKAPLPKLLISEDYLLK